MVVSSKKENYLKHWVHKVKGAVITLHQRILQLDTNKLRDTDIIQNPYQMLFSWFLEITVYGFIITFIQNTYFGWQHWNNVPLVLANGMSMWLLLELIRRIKESIRNTT